MSRFALVIAALCATVACVKIPAFQGHGGDGGPGDGDSNGDGDVDGDAQPSGPPEQWAYIKSPGYGAGDQFGGMIALSGDGATLAVGAPNEDGSASTINGTVTEGTIDAGAVNVFIADTTAAWLSQAYIKPFNPGGGDAFGFAVALSKDGNTLAVGAPFEDGDATSGPGAPNDNALDAGAVYVFVRDTVSGWTFQAYLKASAVGSGDLFGWSVALSNTGDRLVVGAPEEASNATDVGGDDTNNSIPGAGAAYVFTRSSGSWGGPVYLKAQPQSVQGDDGFGGSVAISGDGATIAVGAGAEDSSTTGVNPTPNEVAMNAGAVYTFRYTGASPPWEPQAFLKSTTAAAGAQLGSSVALSDDGNVLVAGAPIESSAGANTSGAAYVYTRSGTTWMSATRIRPAISDAGDNFGTSVAITRDASTVLVGAPGEASNATGIDGDATNNSLGGAGAAYLFANGSSITQRYYVKASNPDLGDRFAGLASSAGGGVSLADVGLRFAVGAAKEDGIPGGDTVDTSSDSGAAYVFRAPL